MKSMFASPEVRVLMLGIDCAGKTTLLYKWKLGEVVTTIPTIGFNVETIEGTRCQATVWDVGGQSKIRPLWRHYLQSTNVVLWVIDASDTSRYAESSDELDKIMANEELHNARLVVVANKMDLPTAGSTEDLMTSFHLADYIPTHKMKLFPVCALTGEGIHEVMMEVMQGGGIKTKVSKDTVIQALLTTLDTETERIFATYNIPLPNRSCAIGPNRVKLPPETLGNIFSFLDVSSLVPRLLNPSEAYLVNKVFAYHAFRELATRLAMEELTPPSDMSYRSLLYLSVPRSLIPIHVYVLGMLSQRYVYVYKAQKSLPDLLNISDGIRVFPTKAEMDTTGETATAQQIYRAQVFRLIVSTQIIFEGMEEFSTLDFLAGKGLEPVLNWIYGKQSGRNEFMEFLFRELRDCIRCFCLAACTTPGLKRFVSDPSKGNQHGMLSQVFALSEVEEAVIRCKEKKFTAFTGTKISERLYLALVDELRRSEESSITTYSIFVPADVDLTPALLKFLKQAKATVKANPKVAVGVEMKDRTPEVYEALFGEDWKAVGEGGSYTIGEVLSQNDM
eukprot:PhF_6_TR41317/c0_g1_i4/m.62595/K07937/ARF1; ADP-ribosylation factor 1